MSWEVWTMRSKRSFFDVRIFKNTLSRFWLAGMAYAAVWVFLFFRDVPRESWRYGMPEEKAVHLIRLCLNSGSYACMFASVGIAALVYYWLFSTRSAAFFTALPLRRDTVFLSDMAAGFTLLELSAAAGLVFSALLGGLGGIAPGWILTWFGTVTLLHILYFGLASLCAAMTGNVVILPALYMILLYAAVALESSLRSLAQFLIFGLTGSSWKLTALSPAYYLSVNCGRLIHTDWEQLVWSGDYITRPAALLRFDGWLILSLYALTGMLCAVLSAVLIRRRSMESAGETVAVPFLKKLFPWCAALAGALTMGLMAMKLVFGFTGYMSPTGSLPRVLTLLLCMLLGAFLGWFGANGLLRRTIRVFDRGWGGFAAVCAAICLLTLGTEFDLWGVERSVPETDAVGSVRVWDTYASYSETEFTQPENIEGAIRLQRKIVDNKKLFETAVGKNWSYNASSALEITYFDRDGKVLMTRRYVAPTGEMAWASGGDSYTADGTGTVSAIGAVVTDGSAPWGSANPALPDLQALLNTPEGIMQRVTPRSLEPKPSNVFNAGCSRMEEYMVTEQFNLDRAEAWELYASCVLPDAADGNIGMLQLLPTAEPETRGNGITLWFTFSDGSEELSRESSVGYVNLFVTERAERTSAWLMAHGLTIPWLVRDLPEEPPVESFIDMDPPQGLAALLENLRSSYSADAAGTVVSARWARNLLEWYTGSGEDPFRVYEDAKAYALRYGSGGEELVSKLERLRTAGLQTVSGQLGLVRDRSAWEDWDEDTVNGFFDAVRAGLAASGGN